METTWGPVRSRPQSAKWRARLVVAHAGGAPAEAEAHLLGPEPRVLRRAQERSRGDPSDLLLAHPSVSRQPHARVRFDEHSGAALVEDLGRPSGTAVDGVALGSQAVPVGSGSVIRVGEVLLVLSVWPSHPLLPADAGEIAPDVSPARWLAERLIERAAASGLHVLILGPTGVGKERLAEHYHRSTGRTGPLVAVNCAGIPGDLFAAELFGHTKGAFSGATGARTGLFAGAHGGTLFLDEVAELPVEQQSAVLRALDHGFIRPVGADADVRVDARVVAATSRDVDRLESEGRIRPDLLGRLAGLRVHLPPLSERREEILPLFRGALGPGAPGLALEAAERLLLYDWPKNVRELIHAAKVVGMFEREVSEFGVELLPEAIRKGQPSPALRPATTGATPGARVLESLLRTHHGNVERVARALGVGRATVHRWMSKHGLSADSFRR